MFKDGVARFSGAGSSSSKQQEGDSSDLTGARVVTTMIVNGSPRTAIEVVEGVRKFRCGPAVCRYVCFHAGKLRSCLWEVWLACCAAVGCWLAGWHNKHVLGMGRFPDCTWSWLRL
jgi:hypothetical protein